LSRRLVKNKSEAIRKSLENELGRGYHFTQSGGNEKSGGVLGIAYHNEYWGSVPENVYQTMESVSKKYGLWISRFDLTPDLNRRFRRVEGVEFEEVSIKSTAILKNFVYLFGMHLRGKSLTLNATQIEGVELSRQDLENALNLMGAKVIGASRKQKR